MYCDEWLPFEAGKKEHGDSFLEAAKDPIIYLAASVADRSVQSFALDTLVQFLLMMTLNKQDQRCLFLLSLMPSDDAMSDNMDISKPVANILHDMFERIAEGKKVVLERLTGMSDNGRCIRGLIWGVIRMVKVVRTALDKPTLKYDTPNQTADTSAIIAHAGEPLKHYFLALSNPLKHIVKNICHWLGNVHVVTHGIIRWHEGQQK